MTRLGEKVGYAAMILAAAVLIYVSRSYALQDGAYPHIVLTLLAILAAVGLYQSFRASRQDQEREEAATQPEPERGAMWPVVIYIGLTMLFILSWNWIGTLPAVFIFSAILVVLNGERRIWMIIALPVVLTAVLYVVFQSILYLPLPRGFFLR